MKAKARRLQTKWWSGATYTRNELDAAAGKLADNLAYCTCYWCQPERAPTRQERAAALDERDTPL